VEVKMASILFFEEVEPSNSIKTGFVLVNLHITKKNKNKNGKC
jgi:hypothetical protein